MGVMRSIRGVMINASVIAVSVVLALIMCEILFRQSMLSDDMGWNTVPPVVKRVKAAGTKKPGVIRILALGDSMTEWRDTSKHSYVRIAESKLRMQGYSVEFVNLAEGGTGLTRYYGNLVTYQAILKPDIVMIGLYLGNDFIASTPPLTSAEGRQAATVGIGTKAPNNWFFRLGRQSTLLNYVYRQSKVHFPRLRSGTLEGLLRQLQEQELRNDSYIRKRIAAVDPMLLEAARADAVNPWFVATAIFFPDYYAQLALAEPGTQFGNFVNAGLSDLLVILSTCRTMNLPVVVVVLSPSVWISEKQQQFFHRLGFERLSTINTQPPLVQRVTSELGEAGAVVIDPLAEMRHTKDNIYLTNDDHLNSLGHALIGQLLAERLADSELLGRRTTAQ